MDSQVLAYLEENQDQFVEDLKTYLRFPSVSANSEHIPDMKQCAEFVRNQLVEAGVETTIVETPGHPIVYGRWDKAEGAPTVMVYGHYDVQPPDPLDQWVTPPFEPDVRNGQIYARGATDDKGQSLTHIIGVAAWLKTVGTLPVNVIFVIEGEEEVGSNNLDHFLESHKTELACDIAVISDTSQYAPGIPAITYGLRGIMACEITVEGPSQDLHSGVFGGSIANPVNALAGMIGKLHNAEGRVQIPGFYDDIIPLTEEECKQFADLPFDEAAFMKEVGVSTGWGEAGFSTTERRWARPTCDVNGFFGGYQGEGPKTIIPASATAKITCRLVPGQDHVQLTAALNKFFKENLPAGLRMTFTDYHGCPGLVFNTDSPYMTSAQKAIEAAFGTAPVMIREGGSIPVGGTFKEILGIDTLFLGWGLNTDNLHSPNEHFSLDSFQKGIAASAHLWGELAKIHSS
ncbi:Acetylornithine deacetylase/Succinyl-diaminopimelate desuccinylase and related deacylases [hydrothermal vent metagenome]|uniref:Acetylornithine deacetylase/Succinyl-diaminopimelate desuccinylase and related deacylases n=1 Tax=hydrothermal vent metagenome TaxID=652676 RepID=A0A3B1DM26_9ZZZZ